MKRAILTVLGLLAFGGAAHAQLSTLPSGFVYSVPGVVNSGTTATFVSCSSTTTSPQTVTVTLLDQALKMVLPHSL